MDIKITLDISDRFDSALMRIASAIQAVTVQTAPAPIESPIACEIHVPKEAPDLLVETPESVEVSKPAEAPKNEPEAKIDPQAAANDDTPAPEVKDESPAEAPKPKRSHHKKVEAPKPEPQAEPECDPEPEAEPDAEGETEMSLDDVRAICVQAAKAGKTKVVTDFLAAHNAQSLSKLDPKHYAELAANVKAAL